MSGHAVTVYEDLAALPAEFEPLFQRAGAESLFHTLPWYRNFLRSGIVPPGKARIYAVASAEPRAVLLMHRSHVGVGILRARALAAAANYYSALFGPVLDPGIPDLQETLDALVRAMAQDRVGWDVIDLQPLPQDGAVFAGLVAAFGKARLPVETYFCFGNWYLELNNQPFAEYIKTRSSRISKTGQRQRRILQESKRLRFELFAGIEGLDRGIADYDTIYNSSWKVPEPFPNFIHDLMRVCAREGWLRLGVAYLDGVPAAAQIWFVVEGAASIYKMAYDERFKKESIGTVLSSLLMEHVIEVDKVKVVDYLSGDDAYKRDWMSLRRERWGIMAFNLRTPLGILAAARHKGARAVKRLVGAVRRPGEGK